MCEPIPEDSFNPVVISGSTISTGAVTPGLGFQHMGGDQLHPSHIVLSFPNIMLAHAKKMQNKQTNKQKSHLPSHWCGLTVQNLI